jgi:glycerol-3-phosphate dehydrogenase
MDGTGSDLNAVRIRTRATMGSCQGGFCTHRLAGVLSENHDEATTRAAWDELLQERWTGQRHGLWGTQLSQAMLNYALHATTQNRDHDPADGDDVDFDAFDAGRQTLAADGGDDGD